MKNLSIISCSTKRESDCIPGVQYASKSHLGADMLVLKEIIKLLFQKKCLKL